MIVTLSLPGTAFAHGGDEFASVFRRISPATEGIDVRLTRGLDAPRIYIRLDVPGTLEIPGLLGEPFARISDEGVFLNVAAPSHKRLTEERRPDPQATGDITALSVPPGDRDLPPPDWERVNDDPVLIYFDPRAEWPFNEPTEDLADFGASTEAYSWEIPATYNGDPIAIEGVVIYTPSITGATQGLLLLPIIVLVLGLAMGESSGRLKLWGTRVLTLCVIAAVAVEGVRTYLESRSGVLPGLAWLWIVGGVAMCAVGGFLAWKQDARGYVTSLIFGMYSLVFGTLRSTYPGSPDFLTLSSIRRFQMWLGLVLVTLATSLLVTARFKTKDDVLSVS